MTRDEYDRLTIDQRLDFHASRGDLSAELVQEAAAEIRRLRGLLASAMADQRAIGQDTAFKFLHDTMQIMMRMERVTMPPKKQTYRRTICLERISTLDRVARLTRFERDRIVADLKAGAA